MTLVCVSSDRRVVAGGCHGGGEGAVELAGDVDIPQGFAVTVGARDRQLGGVESERGQDGEVGVDRVGFARDFAFAAAGLAVGLFALEDGQAGGGGGAGESDAVAAGAFDREGDAGSGGLTPG